MAQTLDNIKDIDSSKETLTLAIRIVDIWFVEAKDKSEQAEMY